MLTTFAPGSTGGRDSDPALEPSEIGGHTLLQRRLALYGKVLVVQSIIYWLTYALIWGPTVGFRQSLGYIASWDVVLLTAIYSLFWVAARGRPRSTPVLLATDIAGSPGHRRRQRLAHARRPGHDLWGFRESHRVHLHPAAARADRTEHRQAHASVRPAHVWPDHPRRGVRRASLRPPIAVVDHDARLQRQLVDHRADLLRCRLCRALRAAAPGPGRAKARAVHAGREAR